MAETRTLVLLVVVAAVSASLGAWFAHRSDATAPPKGANVAQDAAKSLWTCSMHPQVIKEEPGLCPICHMALTPLKSGAKLRARRDPTILSKSLFPAARVCGPGNPIIPSPAIRCSTTLCAGLSARRRCRT